MFNSEIRKFSKKIHDLSDPKMAALSNIFEKFGEKSEERIKRKN